MKQFVSKHTKAKTLIAKSSIQINNTIDEAWKALVNPEIVEKYMLGSQQLSDWQKGSSIIWKKDFNGRKFVDKGEILKFTPPKSLTRRLPASRMRRKITRPFRLPCKRTPKEQPSN